MSLSVKIDWLSFTWFCGSESNNMAQFRAFMEVFPEFKDLEENGIILDFKNYADRFYNRVIGFNDYFRIAYRDMDFVKSGNRNNMGVNVSVPAHGLEYFFGLFGLQVDQVQEMFTILKKRHCRLSRLDIAFDDFSKTLKPYDWASWWVQNKLVTNIHTFKYVASARCKGDTFYIGKRTTGKMLRIYDKSYESDGKIDSVRYEFEYHGKFCEPFFDYIIEFGHVPSFEDFLSKWVINVLDQGTLDQNNRRKSSETDPVYENFLSSVKLSFCEQLQVTSIKDNKDKLKKTCNWLLNNCMPSVKAFIQIFGWKAFQEAISVSDDHSMLEVFKSDYRSGFVDYDGYIKKLLSEKILA